MTVIYKKHSVFYFLLQVFCFFFSCYHQHSVFYILIINIYEDSHKMGLFRAKIFPCIFLFSCDGNCMHPLTALLVIYGIKIQGHMMEFTHQEVHNQFSGRITCAC